MMLMLQSYVCIVQFESTSLISLFHSCPAHILTNSPYFNSVNLLQCFYCNPPVLPIPVVVITGGARHDYYLIRASFDQRHPHYNSIKA